MGWQLILATATNGSWIVFWYNVAVVLLGLNLVILVHELGHFLVARWFGVKCEKFYIWFDIFGLRFFRFRWRDTEYGLGILPLGGYVKMLGQEDNPARIRAEIERAKAAAAAQGRNDPSVDDLSERLLYAPDSYLAQSVPRRMAIISAGVVMNVIFAFLAAVVAYWLGVEHQRCAVGAVFPGEAAWRAGVRPGDLVLEVAGKPVSRFSDLQRAISVGDIDHGVTMVVQRTDLSGKEEQVSLLLHPDRFRPAPTIGVTNGFSNRLSWWYPAIPGSAAAIAQPVFKPGDKVVAINGQPVSSYAQIHAVLARWPDRTLEVTVERANPGQEASPSGGAGTNAPELIQISLPPASVRDLGVVMQMGPIVAVQEGSVAFAAGIREGDILEMIDGNKIGDPLRISDELRRLADQNRSVRLTVRRSESAEPIEVELRPERAAWFDTPLGPDSPASVPALGIAFRVPPVVSAVRAGSPAEAAGLRPGDRVTEVAMLLPNDDSLESGSGTSNQRRNGTPYTLNLESAEASWAIVFSELQNTPAGTKVRLKLSDGRSVDLEPQIVADWFHPHRGLVWAPLTFQLKAQNVGEALWLGGQETTDALTLIVRALQKLGTGQVSPKGLTGPVGIAQIAYGYASEGLAMFLIFLCLISANLAVLNFIPIPVLDGGHFVFLTYEAIRGKPPSESVVTGLTFAGLIFLLGLMIWVTGMDVMRLFGN